MTRGDQRRVRSARNCASLGDVIAVPVRMHDDERNRPAAVTRRPAIDRLPDGGGGIRLLCSRVDEHAPRSQNSR